MHDALLLAKVRIRVPVSGDAATVLTVVGFIVIALFMPLLKIMDSIGSYG